MAVVPLEVILEDLSYFKSLQKLSETFKGLLVEVQRMASASSQVENELVKSAFECYAKYDSDISNDVNKSW